MCPHSVSFPIEFVVPHGEMSPRQVRFHLLGEPLVSRQLDLEKSKKSARMYVKKGSTAVNTWCSSPNTAERITISKELVRVTPTSCHGI